MQSALKHNGKALYEYARAGVTVERQPRQVTIHRIDIIEWQADRPDLLVVDVLCTKGTYIRTLAEDIGEALGCGAHLAGLRRIVSGPVDLRASVTLAALEAMDEAARDACLRPVDVLLADWPAVQLGEADAAFPQRHAPPDRACGCRACARLRPRRALAAGGRPCEGRRADRRPSAESSRSPRAARD